MGYDYLECGACKPCRIPDEATSSVDPENEDELQRAIEALTHDKTIIM